MIFALIPDALVAYFALAVVAVMFIGFLRETYPTEVIALSGFCVFLISGLLPQQAALAVFANPAPWTIGAMFILSGALQRTGALSHMTVLVDRYGRSHPKLLLALLAVLVALSSAVMNNTPVVVIMIPIALQLCAVMGVAGSKLLIPLSYMAIFGGMLTLIGTSTNLLVDGVARAHGMNGFGLFEITPLALCLVGFGAVYLWIFGNRLLPEHRTVFDSLGTRARRFTMQVLIAPNSDWVGSNPLQIKSFSQSGARVMDVLRGNDSLRNRLKTITLRCGDRVVIKAPIAELESFGSADSAQESQVMEALITPACAMVGRTIKQLHLRRQFGVYLVALHRHNQNLRSDIEQTKLQIGDTLLFDGNPSDIARMAEEMGLINLSTPKETPFRRRHAPIVIAALAAVVVLAALGVAPIFVLAAIACALVLLTRAIDAQSAFDAVEGRLLVLIVSMLGVGAGLQASGAVDLIAHALSPLLAGLPPFLVIWAVYLLTSVLTELVSNNAVAVVMTPIAISLAVQLGIDPRPMVVAVMVAASASFATPIGYQTNTLVYGPGGYSFGDFLRVGAPLNLLIGVLSSVLIPIFWPL